MASLLRPGMFVVPNPEFWEKKPKKVKKPKATDEAQNEENETHRRRLNGFIDLDWGTNRHFFSNFFDKKIFFFLGYKMSYPSKKTASFSYPNTDNERSIMNVHELIYGPVRSKTPPRVKKRSPPALAPSTPYDEEIHKNQIGQILQINTYE